MAISKRLMLSATVLSAMFLLNACGEDEASTASTPASAPAAAAPAAEASAPAMESSSMAGIEKAEGVVYQDEMYAGWPYN